MQSLYLGLVKVKSCLVLSDSLCPHGLYSPWKFPGQDTGVSWLSLPQRIFPTQGSNPGLLHCMQIFYQLSHKGSPRILEWIAYHFSSRSSWPRDRNSVSYIAGGFFTNWTIREDQSIGLKKYSNFTPRYITMKTENTWPHKNLHTNVHNSSFFKCRKVVLTQMSKLRYIYTMEYYSVIKKNEIAIYASTWMNFENVILNERNQTQKSHAVWLHEYENVQNRQIHRDTK